MQTPVAVPNAWHHAGLLEFHPSETELAHIHINICAMVKSRYIGDGHPTFNRNPYIYNGYINPYFFVDDHPLPQENNGSLDPDTYI